MSAATIMKRAGNVRDPAAREIIALARTWQRRTSAPDWNEDGEDRPMEFPSEEEAYGQAERAGSDD